MQYWALGLVAIGAGVISIGAWEVLRGRSRRRGSEETYRAAFEQWPEPVLMVEAATLRVLDVNPAMVRLTGHRPEALRRLALEQVIADPQDDPSGLLTKLRDPDARAFEARLLCAEGGARQVELRRQHLRVGTGVVIALSAVDVTVRRKAEAQLLERQQHLDHLAHHDNLTGLPNRLYLAAHLPDAIEECRRKSAMLAVLFLDLDRFKHINDSRGHETGDMLLKVVAERIRAAVRTEDLVVRMGGDEFIVVLRNVRGEQVQDTAGRINQALSAPMVIGGRPVVTTVSIGVSIFPRDGNDMGELLRRSDTAMYQAKDRGRNNVQVFSPTMDKQLKERISVEASLRHAMQKGQLSVHYQPIVQIESRKVVALEALLRWKHPTLGYVPPSRFVGVAEDAGLIVPIGNFVLERVVQDAVDWQKAGGSMVPVAVTISAVQLQRTDLPATIAQLTQQYQLDPHLLQVELTESAVFERRESRNGAASRDAVARLRELGVRIAIDDFGTGYSSLSYLKRWRVDYLKIDRSFVRDLVTDMSDLAIVGAIIAMARHLNIEVIAEGIEGWQQLEKLRQLGCSYAQGYLFARPVPQEQCLRFLSGQPIEHTEDALASTDPGLEPVLAGTG